MAAVQFAHANVHGRLFGFRLDLGTGAYRGIPSDVKLPTVAAENDRWSSSSSSATTSASRGTTAAATSSAAAANRDASEITLTHGSVPVRLDLTVLRIVRDPVVNHNIGIGDAANRHVDIVEHCAIPA